MNENTLDKFTEADGKVEASLLEIGAVLLRPTEPFTWASGWHSPIYCDNRRILSCPPLRDEVARRLADLTGRLYPDADVIAGVATGAIAHGVLVASILNKPFVYVRSSAKDHGTASRIEGVLPRGASVAVVEDLVSTGKSSLSAVQALRDEGARVLGMVAIFTYAFDAASEAFSESGVALDTLADYPTLVKTAKEKGYISPSDVSVLEEWRSNPSAWGR